MERIKVIGELRRLLEIERSGCNYSQELLNWLEERKLNMENLACWGVVFDSYNNKLIFPVHSISGRFVFDVIRHLDPVKEEVKYMYEPRHSRPSNVLYGLHQNLKMIRRANLAIVCEGVSDAMSLSHAGFPAVSSLGASISNVQCGILKVLLKTDVVVWADGDSAGEGFALQASKMLESRKGVSITVNSLDPAETVKKLGSYKIKSMLDYALENSSLYSYVGFDSTGKVVDVLDRCK